MRVGFYAFGKYREGVIKEETDYGYVIVQAPGTGGGWSTFFLPRREVTYV